MVTAVTTESVGEAVRRHGLRGAAAVVLGRGLTAGCLLATLTKQGDERVRIAIQGDGVLGRVLIDAHGDGRVRGCFTAERAARTNLGVEPGRPTLGPLVGAGQIAITRDLGLAKPYQGVVTISSGELDEDLERYLGGTEMPIAARGGALGSVARSTRYFLRRNRFVVAMAATLILTLVAARLLVGEGGLAVAEYYSYDPQTQTLVHDPPAVREGEVLGVTIDTDVPLYVYAVSAFGERDPPTWIAPMEPQILDSSVGLTKKGEERRGWAILVPEGETSLSCTAVGDYDGEVPYEGVWVFASREPDPKIEQWMNTLRTLERPPLGAVPYEAAKRAFDNPPRTRGRPVELTADEESDLSRQLTAERIMGEAEWSFTDSQRFAKFYPVVP